VSEASGRFRYFATKIVVYFRKYFNKTSVTTIPRVFNVSAYTEREIKSARNFSVYDQSVTEMYL